MTHVSQEFLHHLSLGGCCCSLDGILVQFVLLGEGDGLVPSLVLAVDVGSNLSEENEVVLLQSLSEGDGFVVVKVLDTVAQLLVVLLFDEQVVDGIIYGTLVLRLHIEQEWLDERNIVRLLEHANNAVDVDPWRQCLQKVRDERRLLLEVKVEGTVVDLEIGHLDDRLFEGVVLPGICCALHHGQTSIVKFIVVGIEEDEFWPEVCFLNSSNQTRNMNSSPEDAQVLHDTLRMVLAEGNTQGSEHSHVLKRTLVVDMTRDEF